MSFDLSVEKLFEYKGSSPCPEDIDAYWDEYVSNLKKMQVDTLTDIYQKNYGEYEYNLISVDNKNYKIAPNQGCVMNISKANITIEWLQTTTTYNGKKQEGCA